MANTKEYKIVINGLSESISAVDSLNKQLDNLEERINDLQGKGVNVSGGGSSLPKASELTEIEKIEREIAKIQEKQAAHQSEEYKALLMEKEALKQIESQAKASAKAMAGATNPNEIDLNTMAGMKQRMRDLKLQHNNTDINSDLFKEQTREINELNQKLKELEAEYGVYSRNVGNYANGVAEGYKSAKAELKALKTEMQNLTVKQDRGIISEEEAERLKSLIPTVKQLESSIADAGKPMDSLMDAMQSIVAIAQTTKGLSALFGLDDDKIERSIQKLVALQNVMQGLQKLQEQMNTGEGIGKIFTSLDNFAVKAQTGTKAMQGLGKAAAFTSTALKGLSKAFGWIGLAMTAFDVIKDFFNDTEKEAPKAIGRIQELSETMTQMKNSYIDAQTSSLNLASRLTHLQTAYKTTNDELKKTSILKEAAKEFKNLGIQVNSLNDAQNILVEKGDDVINMIREQGKVAAISALRMEAFTKSFKMLMENGYDVEGASILAGQNSLVRQFDALIDKSNEKIAEYKKSLNINDDKTKREVVDAEKELQNLRLKYMKDGLNKRMMLLDEERRQTLNKLKDNQSSYLYAEKVYEQQRLKIIKEYNEQIAKSIENSTKSIGTEKTNNAIERLNIEAERILMKQPRNIGLLTNKEIENYDDEYRTVAEYYSTVEKAYEEHLLTQEQLFERYDKNIKELTEDQQKELEFIYEKTDGDILEKKKAYYEAASEMLKNESKLYREYGIIDEKTLSETIDRRLSATREYHDNVLKEAKENLIERSLIEKKGYVRLRVQAKEEEDKRWEEEDEKLREALSATSEAYLAQLNLFNEKQGELSENELKTFNDIESAYLQAMENYQIASQNHTQKLLNIQEDYNNKIKKLENEAGEERTRIQSSYFESQLSNFREFNSKISNEISKQPIYDALGFGIIDLSSTKKNYKELYDAAKKTFNEIRTEKGNLSISFSSGLLSPEAYNAILTQLNDVETSTKDTIEAIGRDLKDLGGQWWGTINNYVQELGNAIQTVMQAVNDYQDYQLDKQQAYLEDSIDYLEKKLSEQEEILQKHKDNVNSIEDELSSARGDRRQHLIDQLNAEIAAQREAAAEQKRIEKEKQKEQDKLDELDKKRKKQEYHRNLQQILISGALATANGLATQPFVPVGIAMGALATSLAAVQYALAKKQKPYAVGGKLDGGVAVGNSHKDGGIPVLGGHASIEGGEFITNKITTTKNVELLEYINSNKKRIDLSDMIEFFNDKPRATIKSIRSKFENGGTLPNIDLTRGGENTIYIKDETPVVVQVVDIMNKADEVRAVRTIAGAN